MSLLTGPHFGQQLKALNGFQASGLPSSRRGSATPESMAIMNNISNTTRFFHKHIMNR